jgi:hypothetical protein
MKLESVLRFTRSVPFLLLVAILPAIQAQSSAATTGCGKTKISIENATFLTSGSLVIAIQLPLGWQREEKKNNPFFLLRNGDRYETARTLMYVNVQQLDSSFEQAVKNDENDFRQRHSSMQILDEPQPEILEAGCAAETQRFIYQNARETSVEEVTKIGIGGQLINVVLSSDSEAEIARYRKDYKFLLEHLGLVGLVGPAQ